jgi:adenine-specific DNA methylase
MSEHPRRLIEVDLPIRKISDHARREKSLRHGHISTLHLWWARRPLAACRAVVLAALWPDPRCPERFRKAAGDKLSALRDARGGKVYDWRGHASNFAITTRVFRPCFRSKFPQIEGFGTQMGH